MNGVPIINKYIISWNKNYLKLLTLRKVLSYSAIIVLIITLILKIMIDINISLFLTYQSKF